MRGRILGAGDPWYVHVCDLYATLIHDGIGFAEASYGDGEWSCILGKPGHNCDDTAYAPELGERLRETLLRARGQWCSFFDVEGPLRTEALAWIERHRPNVRWTAQRALGRTVVAGEAAPFFRACRTRCVILVGPAHLADLPPEVVGHFSFVPVPMADAWRDEERIAREVKYAIGSGALVLFAAGMASNLLIHRLWPEVRAIGRTTLLDVGAVLDPYCGVKSRRYHSDPEWIAQRMERNLET